jgi:hypothetical protein
MPTGEPHMSAAHGVLILKAVARGLEAVVRAALAPSMMVGLLIAFLALTYVAAVMLTRLLHYTGLGSVLVLWVLITALGVVLVRQLPRVLR